MKDKKAAYRQGVNIFILLAVLTLIEFFLGIWSGSLAWLMLVALAKAGLVVYYYMHIYRVWREESH
jgi:cytochrome c oxidase subunit 4